MEGEAPGDQKNGPGIERGAQAPQPINQEENDMLTDTLYLTLQLAKVALFCGAIYAGTYVMLLLA